MLVRLIVETSDIWRMCICAMLGGFIGGGTLSFFLYDRWAFKKFKHNEEQWQKIVQEQRDIIELYQNSVEVSSDEVRKDFNIDVD